MSTSAGGHGTRVVLAARAASDAQRLLGEAGELARALHAELTGLFVEESDLLRLAGIPVTREVGLASGAVRHIDATATARHLRRQADDVRARVEHLAAVLDLPWSFRVERGDVVELAVAAAARDIVLLAPRPSAWRRVTGPAPQRRGPAVAALYDATEAGERALAIALGLVADRADEVAVLLRAGDDVETARRRLAARPGLASPAVWGERPHPRRAVVVSVASLTGEELRRLLQSEESPVILIR